MKASKRIWKVMQALFMAAIIPLLITGCLSVDKAQSKSDHPEHPKKSSTKKPEHPEHPKKSSTKKPEHPEHPN